MDFADLRVTVDGAVATIVLNRPDRLNAQTPRLWAELARVGRELPDVVGVVVVRGSGRAFSAGLDRAAFTSPDLGGPSLAEMAALPVGKAEAIIKSYQDAFDWLHRDGLMSIAAVQGHAIGAGFQLALACDMRVLTEDALLCMAETSLGLVPDLGGTRPLVAAIGLARSIEVCVTGRRITAAEADRWGLANAVVSVDALDETVSGLTTAILAAPEGAVRETVDLLRGAPFRDHEEQLAAERSAQVRRLRGMLAD